MRRVKRCLYTKEFLEDFDIDYKDEGHFMLDGRLNVVVEIPDNSEFVECRMYETMKEMKVREQREKDNLNRIPTSS